MTFTAEMAEENRRISERAAYLLSFFEEEDVLEDLLQNFPEVSNRRIRSRLDKVQRELHGEAIRERRGGSRPGAGRPAGEVKREKHSPVLAPGTKELARAIAKSQGWDGWGYAVDQAIAELAIRLDISL